MVMVACVLYKSYKFHHLVQHDPKWDSVRFFKMVFFLSITNGCLFQVFMLINVFPQTGSVSVCTSSLNPFIHPSADSIRNCIYAHTWITGSFALVLAPIMSTLMFLFAYHFWFQEFLIGLYLDIMYIGLENRSAEAGLPSHVCRRLHYTSRNHFNELVQGFVQLQNTSTFLKFVYPFQSPAAIICNFVFGLTFSAYVILYPVLIPESYLLSPASEYAFYAIALSWYGASNVHYSLLFVIFSLALVLLCTYVLVAVLTMLITVLLVPCSLLFVICLYSKYGDRVHCCCHIDSVP